MGIKFSEIDEGSSKEGESKEIEAPVLEVIDDEEDAVLEVIEDEEEALFENIKPIKRQRKNKNEIEEMEVEEESTPKTILKKVKKIGKSKKKTADSDVW